MNVFVERWRLREHQQSPTSFIVEKAVSAQHSRSQNKNVPFKTNDTMNILKKKWWDKHSLYNDQWALSRFESVCPMTHINIYKVWCNHSIVSENCHQMKCIFILQPQQSWWGILILLISSVCHTFWYLSLLKNHSSFDPEIS